MRRYGRNRKRRCCNYEKENRFFPYGKHSVQLALLCASHFIIFFSYDDVCGVRYRSDYDVEFEGKNLSLWCEVKFDKMKRKLVQFRFDADLRYEDGEVEIIGSVRDAARKAICFINEYLTG